MVNYQIHFPKMPEGVFRVQLPASKSIANRALILAAQCRGLDLIDNLSDADDTKILYHYLKQPALEQIDAGHGGTTFRFLLALKAIKGTPCIMTGSSRLKERPVGPLVDALRALGADINYLDKEGFPPLKIGAFQPQSNDLVIPANISSQFISAILMMGPAIKGGLSIKLDGTIFSRPYIEMTIEMMRLYGADVVWEGKNIRVNEGAYRPISFTVESDWSAASYFYTLAAFCPKATFELPFLSSNSLQGDAQLVNYGRQLGVRSTFRQDLLILRKDRTHQERIFFDLINEPDLSLALAAACAGLNAAATFSGLASLRIKETDRISALDTELSKVGFRLLAADNEEAEFLLSGTFNMPSTPSFQTYHDHRMAMAMAGLSVFGPVIIEDPGVVSKSFPGYWEEMKKCGMVIKTL